MGLQKVEFSNASGQQLVGRIELPADRHPHSFALFAHCFTCNKNLQAVRNIGKALTNKGFGVLRFDFTGLGESEGEFSKTNFSGNVEDLIAAAAYLEREYQAPQLLIGHSLGGSAVIFAAAQLPSVQALATIGAPSHPTHVKHLFRSSLEEIERSGRAEVQLGGRPFTIQKQFVEDLERQSLGETVKALRKPLLILHSPQDDTVGIKNAEEIYLSAHHPKSFVSLDGADHLLNNKEDSLYTGEVIGSWAQRYLNTAGQAGQTLNTNQHVVASLDGSDGFTTQMKVGKHFVTADEPEKFGGNDFGPSPYELLTAGLSACTVMTLQMYAKRKGWPLDNVEVHTSYGREHAVDCENCEKDSTKIDTFNKTLILEGDLNETQRERLLEIADRCPVNKTLLSPTQVITTLQ